jgi:hypothetical protein
LTIVLNKVQVYTSVPSVDALALSDPGRAETDFIQVRNIDGLDPVKANINMASYGALDGEAYTGGNVPNRNIVLTLHPNPDWVTWTFEQLRQFIYLYFVPKSSVKLIFTSDEVGIVHISGIVENVSANPFSKDPEYFVSIICPDPYFTAVEPEEYSGEAHLPGGSSITTITNEGNIATGIALKVNHTSFGDGTSYIRIQLGNPSTSYFHVVATAGDYGENRYFEMDSRPRHKFVREVSESGEVTDRLAKISSGSVWPLIPPGESGFEVVVDSGDGYESWDLKFFKRFVGI